MQVVLMFVVLTMKVIRITSPASSVGEVSAVTAPRPPVTHGFAFCGFSSRSRPRSETTKWKI